MNCGKKSEIRKLAPDCSAPDLSQGRHDIYNRLEEHNVFGERYKSPCRDVIEFMKMPTVGQIS